MKVTVLYFGLVSDLTNCKQDQFELPADSTIGDLLIQIDRSNPRFAEIARQVQPLLNGTLVDETARLADGDEVALRRASGGSST
jgi:molybdopterin converting factor small subunit